MSNTATDLQEIVLRECAASTPQPWYPSAFLQATGVPRDALDACLDQLRLAGLIQLTDWVAQYGQGYVLTEHGTAVLHNQRQLTALRSGQPPTAPAPRPDPVQQMTPLGRGEAVRSALMEDRPAVVTQWLLYANVGVFLVGLALAVQRQVSLTQYLYGTPIEEVRDIWLVTGALRVDLLLQGQWWRLLTYCFVHLGALHLLMNMYGLYVLGPLVEKMWGRGRYLFLYLVAGLCGGCAQLYVNQGLPLPWPLLGGASGSLCGLLGSMGVWVILNKVHLPPQIASSWLRSIMTNVILIAVISMLPNVSWAGHLGGAVAGAAISFPLNYSRFGVGWQRWAGLAGAFVVPLVGLLLAAQALAPLQAEVQDEVRAEKQKGADAPLTPEEEGLRARFRQRLYKLDEDVESAERDYGSPLRKSKQTKEPWPEEKLKRADAVFVQGQQRADELYEALKKAGPFQGERALNEAAYARKYALQCSNYFGFLHQVTKFAELRDENLTKVNKQWELVRNLRGRWQASKVWN